MGYSPVTFGFTVTWPTRRTAPPASVSGEEPGGTAAASPPVAEARPAHASSAVRSWLSGNEKLIRHYRSIIEGTGRYKGRGINDLEKEMSLLTDGELAAKTAEFRERLAKLLGLSSVEELSQCTDMKAIQKALNEILPEAFAVAREACWRVLGQRPYDVQLMGGIALHQGRIAEMKTGEGKTLTAVMPVYLNALMGQGVHIHTTNDYLTSRDCEMMSEVLTALNMTVGLIAPNRPTAEHQKAYNCDVTYGTLNEMGFDYLRGNIAKRWEDVPNQRDWFFAIGDEVDQIWLDEALTPLILTRLTAMAETLRQADREAARLAHRLQRGKHYTVDEGKRTVALTDEGEDWVAKLTQGDETKRTWLDNALKAKELFKSDHDYVVEDGEVLLVDKKTGRILYGRKFGEPGLQQAIEAKEELRIRIAHQKAVKAGTASSSQAPEIKWTLESQTLATIGCRSFLLQYRKRAGMSGTAKSSKTEFERLYNGIQVTQIPTNRPFRQTRLPDVLCRDRKTKFAKVLAEIQQIRQMGHGSEGRNEYQTRIGEGRPILVGTDSIEESEALAEHLRRAGIPCQVLNAKYHAKEAELIAQAGQVGMVTIATQMAGRGTDIQLGGNPKILTMIQLLKEIQLGGNPKILTEIQLHAENIAPGTPEYELRYAEIFAEKEKEVAKQAAYIRDLGGLYILGTSRSDNSRRIDEQLSGRGSRQGDPSTVRFILSLQDSLFQKYPQLARILSRLPFSDEQPFLILSNLLQKQIRRLQEAAEKDNAAIREAGAELDAELDPYRRRFYAQRNSLLEIPARKSSVDSEAARTPSEGKPIITQLETREDCERLLTRMATQLLEGAFAAFGTDPFVLEKLTAATTDVTEANRDEKLDAFIQALPERLAPYDSDLAVALETAYFELNRELHLTEQLASSADPEKLLLEVRQTLVANAMKAWRDREDAALRRYRETVLENADKQWIAFLNNLSDLRNQIDSMQQNPAITGPARKAFYVNEMSKAFQYMTYLIAYHTLQALAHPPALRMAPLQK